jgi:Helix-turn-helix.|nr:MAG TPA: SOS-response transcriptional repressor [Caudoviricetes sp.]
MKTLETEIRAEMARQSITITDLAGSVGMQRATLARKLREDRPLTIGEAKKISMVLGVSLAVLAARAYAADPVA